MKFSSISDIVANDKGDIGSPRQCWCLVLEKGSLVHAVLWPLVSLVGMGHGLGYFLPRTKSTHRLSLSSSVGMSFFVVYSFVLLKCKWHMEPAQPHFCICVLRGRNGIFPWRHKRVACKWIVLSWLPGETHWPWGTNANYWSWSYSLSSLCEKSIVLLRAWLCCVFPGYADIKMQCTEVFGGPTWDW